MNLAINNTSLLFATALVGIALMIVYKEKLGLGKDILLSVFRAVIQLFAVGYLLGYVFKLNNSVVTLALVLVMSGSVLFIPSQVIPISGMIAIGICYLNLNAEFTDQRQQVLKN